MSHYYTNSASLPTKRRSNTTLPLPQYESTEQKLDLSPQSAPNPVLLMGPLLEKVMRDYYNSSSNDRARLRRIPPPPQISSLMIMEI